MTKGSSFITKLNRPYSLEIAVSRRWISCLRNSLFVFLFLLIFQPFGLSDLPEGIVTVSLGFGLTTFILMTLLNILLLPLFPRYLNEETWNVQKELYWNMVNVLLIGLANALYASFLNMITLSPYSLLVFELYTITIAVFPIAIAVFLKESRSYRKYSKQSAELNVILKEHKIEEIKEEPKTEIPELKVDVVIQINSENDKDSLKITLKDLIFIQSSDNYVEVNYWDKKESRKKLIRNSLKAVSENFEKHKELFRCHKSYLVNVSRVNHISGNAQGYKLHLNGTSTLIPVSRQYNPELKERLNF